MSNYGWDLSHFESATWIEVKTPGDVDLVKRLQAELDDGEAEAIALAVELEADRLLIDERKGSAIAKALGVKAVGLIAVLIEAKTKGVLPNILLVIDELREKGGFWLSNRFYEEIRKMVGE